MRWNHERAGPQDGCVFIGSDLVGYPGMALEGVRYQVVFWDGHIRKVKPYMDTGMFYKMKG